MGRVEIAEHAGACFGVERALGMAHELAGEGGVFTLGPLIHNPRVVEELAEVGVRPVGAAQDCPGASTLLLRTHGVAPSVEQGARDLGLNVVDATCPFVKKAHRAAERLTRDGYQVVVLGERGHAEVEGIVGHAPEALVVNCAQELKDKQLKRRVGVVVQTTQIRAKLNELVVFLLERCDEVLVCNTICDATAERQDAAHDLSRRADTMVVIGGKSSANTVHLAEVCARECERTHHITGPEELRREWFENAELIGITAGASTPQVHITEVAKQIADLCNAQSERA